MSLIELAQQAQKNQRNLSGTFTVDTDEDDEGLLFEKSEAFTPAGVGEGPRKQLFDIFPFLKHALDPENFSCLVHALIIFYLPWPDPSSVSENLDTPELSAVRG